MEARLPEPSFFEGDSRRLACGVVAGLRPPRTGLLTTVIALPPSATQMRSRPDIGRRYWFERDGVVPRGRNVTD